MSPQSHGEASLANVEVRLYTRLNFIWWLFTAGREDVPHPSQYAREFRGKYLDFRIYIQDEQKELYTFKMTQKTNAAYLELHTHTNR
jgi:hypothetical protein